MLDISEATAIIKNAMPNGTIQEIVPHADLYIAQVFTDDQLEGQWDPFYSVNRKTGEFLEFPLLTTPDKAEIISLFMKAKSTPRQEVI